MLNSRTRSFRVAVTFEKAELSSAPALYKSATACASPDPSRVAFFHPNFPRRAFDLDTKLSQRSVQVCKCASVEESEKVEERHRTSWLTRRRHWGNRRVSTFFSDLRELLRGKARALAYFCSLLASDRDSSCLLCFLVC